MKEEKTPQRLIDTVKISGYLVLGGALVGFSLGLYLLFNRTLFSSVIRISQFEAFGFFFGVSVPSFAVLVSVGYLFSTATGINRVNLQDLVPLCMLSLLCLILSALSPFYFISFLGAFITLMTSMIALTGPSFRSLSKGEASFLIEIGAIFVASFSTLYILMWIVSNFLQTYALGFYVSNPPYALLGAGILSFLMFFGILLLKTKRSPRLYGALGISGLVLNILSLLFVIQNRYVLLNATAFVGISMLIFGYVSALVGSLVYIRLSFSERVAPATLLISTPLHNRKYCPYCGKPNDIPFKVFCDYCKRSLTWTPYAAFCSSCGLLAPANAQTCPHCYESIRSKRLYFHIKNSREQAIVDKLMRESTERKSQIMKGLSKMSNAVKPVGRAPQRITHALGRIALSPIEAAFIISATFIFSFLFFWTLRILLLMLA